MNRSAYRVSLTARQVALCAAQAFWFERDLDDLFEQPTNEIELLIERDFESEALQLFTYSPNAAEALKVRFTEQYSVTARVIKLSPRQRRLYHL
jgi:hypothetical protein